MKNAAHTLLIVDDDPDDSEMLEAYFRTNEYNILTAGLGEVAITICRNTYPA